MKNQQVFGGPLRAAFALFFCATTLAASGGLLSPLPASEGGNLVAPFELWTATFSADEGSNPKGPRILLITNDRTTAIAYVRGHRVDLTNTTAKLASCESGHLADTFRSQDPAIVITTEFSSQVGEESCWVQGTISVTAGQETETVMVKGVSGL